MMMPYAPYPILLITDSYWLSIWMLQTEASWKELLSDWPLGWVSRSA